jgi:hypothetical protein
VSRTAARGRDRTDSIRKQLADRSEDEIGKITATLHELETAIRNEIQRAPDPQLSLFSDAERDQEQRNRDFLVSRLTELPPDRVECQVANALTDFRSEDGVLGGDSGTNSSEINLYPSDQTPG